MRSIDKKKSSKILLSAAIAVLAMYPQKSSAEDVADYSNLQTAIISTTASTINVTGDISGSGNLGKLGATPVTLEGNKHNITATSTSSGITVSSGKTLTIQNIGNGYTMTETTSGTTGAIKVAQADGSIKYYTAQATGMSGFTKPVSVAGTVMVTNSTFYNNSDTVLDASSWNSNIKSVDGNFIQNTSTNNGGVIRVLMNTTDFIKGNYIANSSSQNGGAISIESDQNCTVKSIVANFIGNHAAGSDGGGAIYIGQKTNVSGIN